jgi:hypothetical protein
MQESERTILLERFSKLFPNLSGDELEAAHKRFQQYIELAWEVFESTFDNTSENSYPESTKVDSPPTINKKQ